MSKEILKENGKVKAKVIIDGSLHELCTMRNGFQWSGQPMSPELAKLSIEALQDYLKEVSPAQTGL